MTPHTWKRATPPACFRPIDQLIGQPPPETPEPARFYRCTACGTLAVVERRGRRQFYGLTPPLIPPSPAPPCLAAGPEGLEQAHQGTLFGGEL